MSNSRDISSAQFATACARYDFVPSMLPGFFRCTRVPGLQVYAKNGGTTRRLQLAYLIREFDAALKQREQRAPLDHWERVKKQHANVLQFLQWAESQYRLRLDYADALTGAPRDLSSLVDEFLAVDRAALEVAQRIFPDRRESVV